jgi:hypothetical protein
MKNAAYALALLTTLALAACASAPQQSEAATARANNVDPVGTFDFSTSAQGMDINGSIVISRATQGYGGVINTGVTEPIPISNVAVDGQTMRLTGTTPDGNIEMTLTFTGNDFMGSWSHAAGLSGELKGKRRAAGNGT